MYSYPIIPGRLYRVKHLGGSMTVVASHGADAISIVFKRLGLGL